MVISVIIPTYYHEGYIGKAIESVLTQKGDFKLEIVITDDNSKDNTVRIIEEYARKYPNIIKLIKHTSNVGTTQNIYDGFMNAHGKYVSILAGDDCFCDDNKLLKQIFYLENNDNCFAVSTAVKSVYTDGEYICTTPKKDYLGKYFRREDFAKGINYPNHGIMFRNAFDNDNVKKKFHIMVEFSRYIDDLTLCLLYFEFGDVFILPDITYSVTTRRNTDKDQHNYNSVTSELDKLSGHVMLMDCLRDYFGKKVNLDGREMPMAWALLRVIMKTGEVKYLKCLSRTPKRLLVKAGFLALMNRCKRIDEK